MFDTRTKNEIADMLNFLTGFDTDAMSKNKKKHSQLLINEIEELKRRRLDDKKRSN